MSARAKDAFGLILVGIGLIALVLLLLFDLPLVIKAILLIVIIILFVVAALVMVGVISAIPYYFIKHGPTSEAAKDYKLEDVKPVKEDEKK